MKNAARRASIALFLAFSMVSSMLSGVTPASAASNKPFITSFTFSSFTVPYNESPSGTGSRVDVVGGNFDSQYNYLVESGSGENVQIGLPVASADGTHLSFTLPSNFWVYDLGGGYTSVCDPFDPSGSNTLVDPNKCSKDRSSSFADQVYEQEHSGPGTTILVPTTAPMMFSIANANGVSDASFAYYYATGGNTPPATVPVPTLTMSKGDFTDGQTFPFGSKDVILAKFNLTAGSLAAVVTNPSVGVSDQSNPNSYPDVFSKLDLIDNDTGATFSTLKSVTGSAATASQYQRTLNPNETAHYTLRATVRGANLGSAYGQGLTPVNLKLSAQFQFGNTQFVSSDSLPGKALASFTVGGKDNKTSPGTGSGSGTTPSSSNTYAVSCEPNTYSTSTTATVKQLVGWNATVLANGIDISSDPSLSSTWRLPGSVTLHGGILSHLGEQAKYTTPGTKTASVTVRKESKVIAKNVQCTSLQVVSDGTGGSGSGKTGTGGTKGGSGSGSGGSGSSSGSSGGSDTVTAATLSISSPTDGTSIEAGKRLALAWTSTGLKKNVSLSVSLIGTAGSVSLKALRNDGAGAIIIPKDTVPGAYQLSLTSGSTSATSPSFTVTAPVVKTGGHSGGTGAGGNAGGGTTGGSGTAGGSSGGGSSIGGGGNGGNATTGSQAVVSCSGKQTGAKDITWDISVTGANATHVVWKGTGSNIDGKEGNEVVAHYIAFGQKAARADVSLDNGSSKTVSCSVRLEKGSGNSGSILDSVGSFWNFMWGK